MLDEARKRRLLVGLVVTLCAALLYLVGQAYYRPFIQRNRLDDWYLGETLGNLLGTVAAVCMTIGLIGRDRAYNRALIVVVTLALLLVELVALPLLGEPLDLADAVATLLAGGGCFLGYRWVGGG